MSPWVIAVFVILFGSLLAFIIPKAVKAQRPRTATGQEELQGSTGVVRTALKPEGMVMFKGELWDAVSESGTVNAGEPVCINRIDGLTLYVSKIKKGGS